MVEYDLATANQMFKTSRFVYVVFMCHLAIEKILKAIVCEETNRVPPIEAKGYTPEEIQLAQEASFLKDILQYRKVYNTSPKSSPDPALSGSKRLGLRKLSKYGRKNHPAVSGIFLEVGVAV